MEKNKPQQPSGESEVREVIEAFEQILDAIPNDRLALETLSDAYLQIGDKAKALDYLIRLGNAVVEEGNPSAAADLAGKLRGLAGNNSEATKMLAALEKVSRAGAAKAAAMSERTEATRRKAVDITAELALAWNLAQANIFTQEDYASVVHDLTESSSRQVEVPVTVLHVLHDRGFKNLDRVLNHLASDSGIPLLNLAHFEPQKDAYLLVPVEVMQHRGAIPFEVMGQDVLVAILNPYDTELRDDVARITGRACHFYLVPAESYDRALSTILKALQEQAAREKEKPA